MLVRIEFRRIDGEKVLVQFNYWLKSIHFVTFQTYDVLLLKVYFWELDNINVQFLVQSYSSVSGNQLNH